MHKKFLWNSLVVPPILFLFTIVGLSVFYSISGVTDSDQISVQINSNIPVVLLIVQVLLLGFVTILLRKQKLFNLGWAQAKDAGLLKECTWGVILGIGLGLAYITCLSPLHAYLQATFGDYVPAGQVLTALGGGMVVFFIANVLLAPFVEERLYRGYALTELSQRFGNTKAIIISSVFFGLLHWMGGLWYMVLTGGVIGILFGILALKRGSIVLVFAAHLALNFVEFVYVATR
jgi:uncharacterized protein